MGATVLSDESLALASGRFDPRSEAFMKELRSLIKPVIDSIRLGGSDVDQAPCYREGACITVRVVVPCGRNDIVHAGTRRVGLDENPGSAPGLTTLGRALARSDSSFVTGESDMPSPAPSSLRPRHFGARGVNDDSPSSEAPEQEADSEEEDEKPEVRPCSRQAALMCPTFTGRAVATLAGMGYQAGKKVVQQATKPLKCASKCMKNFAVDAAGISRLYVLDLLLPVDVYHAAVQCTGVAQCAAKNASNVCMARTATAVTVIVDKRGSGFTHAQKAYLYAAARLTTACLVCDGLSATSDRFTTPLYWERMEIPVAPDEEAVEIADLEAEAIDSSAAVENALMNLGFGEDTHALPARPAVEFTGERPSTGLSFIEDADEVNAYLAKEALDRVVGAVVTGPNFGKSFPLNPKDVLSMASAYTRHFCDVTKKLDAGIGPCGQHVEYEFVLHRDLPSSDLIMLEQVWADMAKRDRNIVEHCLKAGYCTPAFDGSAKPHKMSVETFLEGDISSHIVEAMGLNVDKPFTGSLFNKSGEDGDRARFISNPGRLGTEVQHVARMSPLVKFLEDCFKRYQSHSHIKGLDEDAKREAMADFLGSVPKGYGVFSFDKSANDRTWTARHWRMFCSYMDEVCGGLFGLWCQTHVLNFQELDAGTRLKMRHKFGVFIMESFLMYLLSGVVPTSLGNRKMSEAEVGVFLKATFGEDAYRAWLDYSDPTKNVPLPSRRPYFLTKWEHGVRTVWDMKKLQACSNDEGDDKTMAVNLTVGDKTYKYDEMLHHIVTTAADKCGAAYVVAKKPRKMENVGYRSIIEYCSAVIGVDTENLSLPATIVPLPHKALLKCAWSVTHIVKMSKDGYGNNVGAVYDQTFATYAATKFLALARVNFQSLGVRWIFRGMARYHFEKLAKMIGVNKAFLTAPLWGDRDPEARGIEEYASTAFTTLAQAFADVDAALESVALTKGLLHVNASAWLMDFDRLDAAGKTITEVAAALIGFDESARTLEINDVTAKQALALITDLDLGILKPVLLRALTTGNYKIIEDVKHFDRTPEESMEIARSVLEPKSAAKKPKPPKADEADSADSSNKKSKGKGKGKSDRRRSDWTGKGQSPAHPHRGQGKPSGATGGGRGARA
jgi:hypothetical protein